MNQSMNPNPDERPRAASWSVGYAVCAFGGGRLPQTITGSASHEAKGLWWFFLVD
jgi:hypothetical protein